MRSFIDIVPSDISFDVFQKPWINANHIDGPCLFFSDGQMHWLTLWERILYKWGKTNAEKLQRKLRPNLTKFLEWERRNINNRN